MWSVWLVFCDCAYSICSLRDKDKRLMEASWRERLTVRETGSCSDGQGLLSKSLIQFSVDGNTLFQQHKREGCVPSLLFTWSQTMVEVMKIMGTSFKRSHAGTATPSAPNHAAGHRQPTPPLEIPGRSQASLGQAFVGSLLLSPGSWYMQVSVWALQESISQVCVSSGSFSVGLKLCGC